MSLPVAVAGYSDESNGDQHPLPGYHVVEPSFDRTPSANPERGAKDSDICRNPNAELLGVDEPYAIIVRVNRPVDRSVVSPLTPLGTMNAYCVMLNHWTRSWITGA